MGEKFSLPPEKEALGLKRSKPSKPSKAARSARRTVKFACSNGSTAVPVWGPVEKVGEAFVTPPQRTIQVPTHYGESNYYSTHVGLGRGKLSPLFSEPVELLANSRSFYWLVNTVKGTGQLIDFQSAAVPGLSKVQCLAISAEDIRRVVESIRRAGTSKDATVNQKRLLKRVAIYYRQLQTLSFLRATWDALLLGYQEIRRVCSRRGRVWYLNSNTIRSVERFKLSLIMEPEAAAQRLKSLAAAARKWYFDGKIPQDHLWRSCPEKWMGLTFSYVGRSLPAPMRDTGFSALKDRLTSEPPAELTGWRPWVKEYLTRIRSPVAADLRTQPSGHAAIGYTRSMGGHSTAIQDLTCIGYLLEQGITPEGVYTPRFGDNYTSRNEFTSAPFSKNRFGEKGKPINSPEEFPYSSLEAMAESSGKHQDALIRGTLWVMDHVPVLPVLPIEAGEKGLKTRFPTCALTAGNLIQQILRRAIDHIMIKDPRMSNACGGDIPPVIPGRGPYYSQDMSNATDLHPFWLTRTVYEELAEVDHRLQKYVKYFDLLFGPKLLLLKPLEHAVSVGPGVEDVELFDFSEAPRIPTELNFTSPDWVEERIVRSPFIPRRLVGLAKGYLRDYLDWLSLVTNPIYGVMTTTGAMMGDPTSFPLMPLMSAYCAELAGFPHNEGALTGDDAFYGKAYSRRVARYEATMPLLGGTISPEKTFVHLRKALFTENPYYDGLVQHHTTLSNWVAPPGGSKGQVNWVTQVLTIGQQNVNQGVDRKAGLWYFSPYWQMHKAAFLMGLPIGAPPELGGVGHPRFPCASVTDHFRWLTYLSGLSKEQLVSGTGLTLVASPHQLMRKKGADHVMAQINQGTAELQMLEAYCREYPSEAADIELPQPVVFGSNYDSSGRVRPTLVEACDKAAGSLISWEFYFRSPVIVDRAPSIRKAVSRFRHRVSKCPPISGSYRNVHLELQRKRIAYVAPSLIVRGRRKCYGLEQTGIARPIAKRHWIPGRQLWG